MNPFPTGEAKALVEQLASALSARPIARRPPEAAESKVAGEERTLGGKRVTVRRGKVRAYTVVNQFAMDDFKARPGTFRRARYASIVKHTDTRSAEVYFRENYPDLAAEHTLPFERYAKAGVIAFV